MLVTLVVKADQIPGRKGIQRIEFDSDRMIFDLIEIVKTTYGMAPEAKISLTLFERKTTILEEDKPLSFYNIRNEAKIKVSPARAKGGNH